tara:strand:+ start:101 stop:715 length:615 start_codon:yes stop_codon:yes gene_type:complete
MKIKLANPQGKGLERISDALQILQEVRVEHKKPIQILRDYCCSLLVLASEFSFLPIPNRYYFLFLSGEKFKLSPISPKEWGHSRFGDYIAKCRLETDMTWSGIWRHDLEDFPALNAKIRGHMKDSLEMIFESENMIDNLPFCDRHLSYYRRVLALGLSSSIELSFKQVGFDCMSGREALESFGGELKSLNKSLLSYDGGLGDLT